MNNGAKMFLPIYTFPGQFPTDLDRFWPFRPKKKPRRPSLTDVFQKISILLFTQNTTVFVAR